MNRKEIEEWLIKYKITNYTIHDNLMVDVHQSVWLNRSNLTSLPFQFGIVQGDFYCSDNQLISLEHCPKVVQGHFVFDGYLRNDIRALRHHLAKQLQSL